LGDLSLDTQLQALRIGANTPILEQSLGFAEIDADARAQNVSLFQGRRIPRSHASMPYALGRRPFREIEIGHLDWVVGLGFETIKLKAGASPVGEIQQLATMAPIFRQKGLKARLDFNERLSFEDAIGFLSSLEQESGGDLRWIDWLEDPCPYDADNWSRIQAAFGIPLALDLAMGRTAEQPADAFDILVVKPAVQPSQQMFDFAGSIGVPVAITSYLDHPFGQSCAAWVASHAVSAGVPQVPGGLASHIAYEPNEFSNELGLADARLLPATGTGFGFDHILLQQDWEELR
jgi:O-succinylbenzoate synthase